MSASSLSEHLPNSLPPEFFSPKSGEALAKATAHTIRASIEPDAVVWSATGKPYPLYKRETLEVWAREREAAGLGPAKWRSTRATRQHAAARKAREAQGGAR